MPRAARLSQVQQRSCSRLVAVLPAPLHSPDQGLQNFCARHRLPKALQYAHAAFRVVKSVPLSQRDRQSIHPGDMTCRPVDGRRKSLRHSPRGGAQGRPAMFHACPPAHRCGRGVEVSATLHHKAVRPCHAGIGIHNRPPQNRRLPSGKSWTGFGHYGWQIAETHGRAHRGVCGRKRCRTHRCRVCG